MRTTIRLDEDLFERLKLEARRENVSLTSLINRTIRAGLNGGRRKRRPPYKEAPCNLGTPRFRVDKALEFAAALEDEDTLRKLMHGK